MLEKQKHSPGKSENLSEKGFTIVEIVVVIILMLAVIVPAARVIASALEASNEEQYLSHCAFLAQMKIEKVRAGSNCYTDDVGAGCPQTGGGDDFTNDFSENAAACSFPVPFQKYECTISDTQVAFGLNDLKTIQVRVWYDKDQDGTRDSNEPQVYLETMITSRPPN